MKILQTARWFFPHVGGASIRVYQTAKNLVKFGHEVHLLVHNPRSVPQCSLEEEAPAYEEYDGIRVYRLPYFRPQSLYWASSIPLLAKKAIEIIRKGKIDVILSHNPPYLVGAGSLIASKLTGTPMVVNVHDVWGASHYGRVQYRVGEILESLCISNADRIIAVNPKVKNTLMEETGRDPESFSVAETGVDPETFKPMPAKEDDKLVLFVGALAPWTGCKYLIEAAPLIVKEEPDVRFKIVGHGVEYDSLVEKTRALGLADKIEFVGAVPPESLPATINEACVCASPFPSSRTVNRKPHTSKPISVLEFMACGKPVVRSDNPGSEDVTLHEKTGLLFRSEDTEDLAEKIVYLLKNPDERTRIGKNARELILKGNTWEDTARKVEKALLEALSGNPRQT